MGSLLWASFCFFCLAERRGVVVKRLVALLMVVVVVIWDEGENEVERETRRGVVRGNALERWRARSTVERIELIGIIIALACK